MSVLLMAIAAALVGCGGTHRAAGTPRSTQVTVNVSTGKCGTGWTKPVAGHQDFLLDNTDTSPGDVLLTDAKMGAVYAYVEPLAPGTTAHMAVDLGAGTHAFRCVMEDTDVVVGPAITVTGDARAAVPPVLPVSQLDMIGPTKRYADYVAHALPGLRALVVALRDAIARNDLAGARSDWLAAHLAYERLGAAYGAFGDADDAINGRPSGRPGGVHDKRFTGFHRVEYDLWHGAATTALTPQATTLLHAVDDLITNFAKQQLDPTEVAIRAHEITENTVQFELTGETDFGSGSNLATAQANLDGTREVLSLLTPLLAKRYPALPELNATLARASADLNAQHRSGRWTPLADLTTSARERIDADFGELTELLAPVASICEPRRTS